MKLLQNKWKIYLLKYTFQYKKTKLSSWWLQCFKYSFLIKALKFKRKRKTVKKFPLFFMSIEWVFNSNEFAILRTSMFTILIFKLFFEVCPGPYICNYRIWLLILLKSLSQSILVSEFSRLKNLKKTHPRDPMLKYNLKKSWI